MTRTHAPASSTGVFPGRLPLGHPTPVHINDLRATPSLEAVMHIGSGLWLDTCRLTLADSQCRRVLPTAQVYIEDPYMRSIREGSNGHFTEGLPRLWGEMMIKMNKMRMYSRQSWCNWGHRFTQSKCQRCMHRTNTNATDIIG
ncbi:hypothetical protein P691DRAFT_806393 [Macrolepiota fuliginosa MF-IS2]|uniref:Uncharacterized protein n=1 Tax=Macrolepiota fuliginosa MF-IS2 TaxID=1400762 RepID=A0A9P5X5L9_9AGAR|nr:hypothetical protein P691DRAFT_806393 [Macrolepiota fuliginosa MF-IS2]